MKRYTATELLSLGIEDIENATIVYKDDAQYSGFFSIEERSTWEDDEVPEFTLCTDGGFLIGDELHKLKWVIDNDA